MKGSRRARTASDSERYAPSTIRQYSRPLFDMTCAGGALRFKRAGMARSGVTLTLWGGEPQNNFAGLLMQFAIRIAIGAVPMRSVPPRGSGWAGTLPIANCQMPIGRFVKNQLAIGN